MDIREPRLQKIWRLPAVTNFTLGSMGAAYFIWTWLDGVLAFGADAPERVGYAGAVAAFLIFAGFFALLFEAGNPVKSYLTLLNIRHSWMSRELWLALVFAILTGIGLFYPSFVVFWVSAVVAVLFIVSQAYIVFRSRAVLAWNTMSIVPLFTLTGLSSGFGLYLALGLRSETASLLLLLGGATWTLCLAALLCYLFGFNNQDADFRSATRALRAPKALWVGAGVGLVAPLAILAVVTLGLVGSYSGHALALAGAGAVLGAWQRNYGIVMKAGYFRRIRINA